MAELKARADSPQRPPPPAVISLTTDSLRIPNTCRVANLPVGGVLSVRSGPDWNHAEVGTLPADLQGIAVGKARYSDGSAVWREVWIGTKTGFVLEQYLADDGGRR